MSIPDGYVTTFENGAAPDPRTGADDPNEGLSHLGAIPEYPIGALPSAARELVARAARDGLPPALTAGAALAALAGAIGAAARIEITPTWHERPILWISPMAPRGAGKSPAQDLAFSPLRDHDAQLADDEESTPVRLGDQTLEALARNLHAAGGAGVIDIDELATLLRGLGEYKRGGGGDRGRFLALWSGAPWSLDRVGGGGKKNNVRLRIPRPTLVICGGLQPALHELLGGEDDGLRPRWLPHLAALPEETGSLSNRARVVGWQQLLGGDLVPKRGDEREWKLDRHGLAAFEHYRRAWKEQARDGEAASVSAALVKADVHLARVALVLAEAENPAGGGPIGADLVSRAALIVEFTLNCWRALPEQGGFALSRRDWLLDQGISRLLAYLDEHGGQASRRELQRARVGGARTGSDLDALLKRYEEHFPGTVTEATPDQGGLKTLVIRAPSRRPVPTVSPLATPLVGAEANPHEQAENDGVVSGDTDSGDIESGDTSVTAAEEVAAAVRNGSLTPEQAAAVEAYFTEHGDESGHV